MPPVGATSQVVVGHQPRAPETAPVAGQPGTRCSLSHGHVAAIAGVSVSTVKRAVRAARLAGLVEVTIRRVSAFRNDTNVVVVPADWKAWLSRRGEARGGGVQGGAGTNTRISRKAAETVPARAGRGQNDRWRQSNRRSGLI